MIRTPPRSPRRRRPCHSSLSVTAQAAPTCVPLGSVVTVLFTVSNTGATSFQFVSMTTVLNTGSGGDLPLSGPAPTNVSLSAGSSQVFTYTRSAVGLGSLAYRSSAVGYPFGLGSAVTVTAFSNGVTVDNTLCAPSQTPSPSLTASPSATATFSPTDIQSPTLTATPSASPSVTPASPACANAWTGAVAGVLTWTAEMESGVLSGTMQMLSDPAASNGYFVDSSANKATEDTLSAPGTVAAVFP